MVIVRIWQGLGNQLFQYAYARALSMRGVSVRVDLGKAYEESFYHDWRYDKRENGIQNFRIQLKGIDVYGYKKYDYLKRDTFQRKIIFELAKHHMWDYCFIDDDAFQFEKYLLNLRGNYYIKGLFQNERYFKDIRSILLREFTPQKKIKISPEIRVALNSKQSVSVHVRKGDFARLGVELNIYYYYKAIRKIKEKYDNPIFLIFSNNIEWVKTHLTIDEPCVYVNEDGALKDYEELFIMSRCQSNIIPNSTFSWWGAWLNQNPDKWVIAPKKWGIGPDAKDVLPEEWIKL